MHQPIDALQPAFEACRDEVYRVCFVLSRSPKAAGELAFQAFLRLGAAKEPPKDEADARRMLFAAAVRLCDDWFLKKAHRLPRREVLEAAGLPFAVSDALWQVLKLPFSRRAVTALMACGFTASEARTFLRQSGRGKAKGFTPTPEQTEAVRTVCLTEDDVTVLEDRIYTRFSERSVGIENAIHNIRSVFDRIAPLLALAAIAIAAFSYWYVGQINP